MRSTIGLLFIARGLTSAHSLCNDAQARNTLLYRDSGITTRLQARSNENSYIPLQRRSPGRSKINRGKLLSPEEAILLAPSAPQVVGLNELIVDTRQSSISTLGKAIVGSPNQPSSSKKGSTAKPKEKTKEREQPHKTPQDTSQPSSSKKTKERARPRKKPEDTKPSAPPLPDSLLATASSSRRRSPSPPYMLSEPNIRGEGSRQGQGSARTPSDKSSSPAGSQSSSRSTSPGARSSSGTSQSPARSPSPPIRWSNPGSPRPPPRMPSPLPKVQPATRSPSTSSTSYRSRSASFRSPPPSGPLPGTSLAGDQKFDDWIVAMQEMSKALKSAEPAARHSADLEAIRTVKEMTEQAKRRRDKADRSRIAATTLRDNRRAGSPDVGDAMKRANEHAEMAVSAIKSQTAAQTGATFALKGTEKHQDAINYWNSSARQWIRAQARDAHRAAFATEHNARVYKQVAMAASADNPRRGTSFKNAADAKKLAVHDANIYYRRRKQYEIVKKVFSDANSSSDEEWPLKDTPRTSK